MKPIKFLLISFSTLLILLITYVLVVDKSVFIQREVPYTYRQFVLETLSPIQGKVIIESGSNSIHSMAPKLLSQWFKQPVYTIADNGDYPLKLKIYNLYKNLQKGDSLVLPLEWNQYYDKNVLTENFAKTLADENLSLAHYYHHLPLIEKVIFLYRQFPFYEVIQALQHSRNINQMRREDLVRLNKFQRLLQSNSVESYGNSTRNGPENKVIAPIHKTCERYLFHTDFSIGQVFKDNLKHLQDLQQKGVNIYFTWPATVDHQSSHCYDNKDHLNQVKQYVQRISNEINQAGFPIIGQFMDSHFAEECFLNTHYHLKRDCALERTKQLINDFKQYFQQNSDKHSSNNLLSLDKQHLDKQQLEIQIDKRRQLIIEKILTQYPTLSEGKIASAQFDTNLLFNKGWSAIEKWGIWSEGTQSQITFRVLSAVLDKQSIKITLRGRYFNGQEKTAISINSKAYQPQVLTHASFAIPTKIIKNNIITISFLHTNTQSPKQLGLSADNRQLKYGLQSLEISSASLANKAQDDD